MRADGHYHAKRLDVLPGTEEIRRIFASRVHVEFEFVREIGKCGRGQLAEHFAVRQFESFFGDIGRIAIGQAGMIVAG